MLKVESKYDERIDALHAVRVNVKSLAAEARLIRKETQRAGRAYKDGLALHRRGRLREEARYTHLALAFIRRRAYRQVEEKCFVPPDVNRLHKKVERFWRRVELKEVVAWFELNNAVATPNGRQPAFNPAEGGSIPPAAV